MFDKKNWIQSGALAQIPNTFPPAYILGIPSQKETKTSFYTPDFFQTQNSFWKAEVVQKTTLLSFLEGKKENWSFSKWQPPCFQNFKKQFDDFQNLAKKEVLKKVVPVFFSTSPKNSFNKNHLCFLIKNLLQKKEGLVYGMWNSKEGLLGCTPEYLFSQKDSSISTIALAGTAQDSNHRLLQDTKEVNEHQMVVQYICNSWEPNTSVEKSKMYEWNFETLKHLRTDLSFQTRKKFSFLEIAQKMHPTPALGGIPKKEALDWLAKHEKKNSVKRKRFGAPFGVQLDSNRGFCLVAIRNIQWDSDQFILGSGVGLTQKSLLEREWAELELKRKSILNFFKPHID